MRGILSIWWGETEDGRRDTREQWSPEETEWNPGCRCPYPFRNAGITSVANRFIIARS
jgi:hypothetical protein